VLIFLLICISLGKFGQAANGTEEDEETVNIRGFDGGKGGYADIPILEERPIGIDDA